MAESLLPGDAPVSLNEARSWLRLGATIEDAVIAGLVRAATNICEAFTGQWLVVRAGEEAVPLRAGTARLSARPIVAVDGATLLLPTGGEVVLGAGAFRTAIGRDGAARVSISDPGQATRVRVAYRAGMAEGANGVPEAVRQGILRMTQHLYDARERGDETPPAIIAALWQPWRVLSLGSGR